MGKKFYMGGICGMGMAPLAAFLKDAGQTVSGFDDNANADLKRELEKRGIMFGDFSGDEDEVVLSTALWKNPDALRERFHNKKIMRRGECWAEICKTRKLTAVVGSHGKSTVSAMLAHAANKIDEKCGWLVGAVPREFHMHKYCAEGETVISEIDESDGTIENFSPEITVALNADLDHTDTYADYDRLEEMFARLFDRTTRLILYPENDAILTKLARRTQTPSRAVKAEGDFTARNKAMAVAALEETFLRTIPSDILSDFQGLLRRQEIFCNSNGVAVVADYAHHPNEVKSFLEWFDKSFDGKKLIIFQPHRYTRTRRFAKEFANILSAHVNENSDVVLFPVYAASETFDPLGTSEKIIECASKPITLSDPEDFERLMSAKLSTCNNCNIAVAIVGAGDFYFRAKEFFKGKKHV